MIGNGHYPDANAPLTQSINDARALSAALRHDGFDVDMVEDAGKADLRQAVDRLKSKIRSDSTVMLFFAGYGVQAGRQSYMKLAGAKIAMMVRLMAITARPISSAASSAAR